MRTIKLVSGSVVVYLAVACMSAIEMAPSPPPLGATPVGPIADALTDPVREAKAQSLPPITATENCDKGTPFAGTTVVYAEHAFAGYTAEQLAAVRAIGTPPAGAAMNNPPYARGQALAYLRDTRTTT
jgi:hypothetical protein